MGKSTVWTRRHHHHRAELRWWHHRHRALLPPGLLRALPKGVLQHPVRWRCCSLRRRSGLAALPGQLRLLHDREGLRLVRARRGSNRIACLPLALLRAPALAELRPLFAMDGYAEAIGLGSVTIAGDQNAIWSAGAFTGQRGPDRRRRLRARRGVRGAGEGSARRADRRGRETAPVTKQKSRTKFTWRKKGEASSTRRATDPTWSSAPPRPAGPEQRARGASGPFISGTPPANPFLAQRA